MYYHKAVLNDSSRNYFIADTGEIDDTFEILTQTLFYSETIVKIMIEH